MIKVRLKHILKKELDLLNNLCKILENQNKKLRRKDVFNMKYKFLEFSSSQSQKINSLIENQGTDHRLGKLFL